MRRADEVQEEGIVGHVYAASPVVRGYTRAAESHWIKVLSSGELGGCSAKKHNRGQTSGRVYIWPYSYCIFGHDSFLSVAGETGELHYTAAPVKYRKAG